MLEKKAFEWALTKTEKKSFLPERNLQQDQTWPEEPIKNR